MNMTLDREMKQIENGVDVEMKQIENGVDVEIKQTENGVDVVDYYSSDIVFNDSKHRCYFFGRLF